MQLELPSRLYGEGSEPQVKKINNSCRLKLLELLKEKMEPEFDEVMKDPIFSHIMVIQKNDIKFSARLVHSFLCKELMTSKRHEKWFTFARRPLRFGLQEYHGHWSESEAREERWIIKKKHLEESNTWTWGDRVRLIYLCVIMGVVMGKDEKVNIPHLYMKLAMDLEKLRNYPWGLYSFDFLLKQLDKTRHKLEQKERYLMEGFLFGFQIWIMEAVPALGEICGTKASKKFTENVDGTADVSGRNERKHADRGAESRKKNVLCQLAASSKRNIDKDMKNFLEGLVQASFTTFGEKFCQQFSDRLGKIETEVTQLRTASERTEQFETVVTDMLGKIEAEGILHSFMESHIDGVVLLATDFVQKDEKKDERLAKKKREDQAADTERGENSHVAENVDGTTDVSGRNKRKHADQGAESRKKNVLCQLAASSKRNIDTDMKNFLEGLVQASFTTFGEKFCQQFSDRLGKIETEVTQLRTASERTEQFETVVTDRLGKIEAEVTQLRTTLVVIELVGKSDQASGRSMTKINTGPSTSKKGTAPSKKNLHEEPSIVTFVKGLNPSKAKVEDSLDWLELPKSLKKPADSLDWLELPKSLKKPADSLELPKSLKKPAVRLDDRDMELDGEDFPYRCLVFVHPADFKKMQDWQNTRTHVIPLAIQIGPSMLDDDLAGRIMYEIDDVMYVFRERTTLKRWNVDRVAFMTSVFSDLIAKDYQNFSKGIKKYTMDPLLLEYGKGELSSHGRKRMLWNVDVDRITFLSGCLIARVEKIKEVEAFAQLIPRIVKAVQSLTVQKHLTITPYNVSYVPMSGLNRLNCHCGVYTIKHIKCHVLGLDISLVSDDNIWGARIKIV
uniref:DUF1985 domain-containing protein n=1 Tax=Brassica oleracea var. oleracea TaxID=109376 RepID=A0A0D3E9D2_BRAOL